MDINSLLEYIEQNFRKTLYRMDYEILEDIAKQNYSEAAIKSAIDYCIEHNSDSTRYLQKVLQNQKKEEPKKTSWIDNEELVKEMLDAADRKFAREFYYQFCDSKEEAEKTIKELNLED